MLPVGLFVVLAGVSGCDDKPDVDGSAFLTGGADTSTGGSTAQPPPGQSGGQAVSGGTIGSGAVMTGGGGAVAATGGAASGGSGGDVVTGGAGSGGAGSGGEIADGPRGTGVGDWGPGDYPSDLAAESYLEIAGLPNQAGLARQYKVHVPQSYDPSRPMPLVYCIHGLSQTPVMFCINGAKLVDTSDQEVSGHLNVDLDRVFATGLSNGGYMSYRLACEAADLFAAVAPAAGLIGLPDVYGTNPATSDLVDCQPPRPIPIFDTHGDADGIVPFASKADTLEVARSFNGCSASTVPATDPVSAGDTTCVTYEGCDADVELTACTVAGGGHCWFGSEDCGTGGGAIGAVFVGAGSDTLRNNEAVWHFFERNPMPR